MAERDQAGALGIAVDAGLQRDGAELFGGAFGGAHEDVLKTLAYRAGLLILKG
jgi:hypothetical protein